jgi:hypothetical protein
MAVFPASTRAAETEPAPATNPQLRAARYYAGLGDLSSLELAMRGMTGVSGAEKDALRLTGTRNAIRWSHRNAAEAAWTGNLAEMAFHLNGARTAAEAAGVSLDQRRRDAIAGRGLRYALDNIRISALTGDGFTEEMLQFATEHARSLGASLPPDRVRGVRSAQVASRLNEAYWARRKGNFDRAGKLLQEAAALAPKAGAWTRWTGPARIAVAQFKLQRAARSKAGAGPR